MVFIAGLEEGLFPHSRALDDEQELEEERRLAYVGITRAKRRLFLSHAWRRATWGMGQASVPSRFLLEIPPSSWKGPQLAATDDGRDLDLDLVFGARRTTRFNTPVRGAGPAYRQGSGRPGRHRPGSRSGPRATSAPSARPSPMAPARASCRVRRCAPGTTRSSASDEPEGTGPRRPGRSRSCEGNRPVIPGERQFRDGDRVRHAVGRGHRRHLEAHPERRGGHGRVQGRGHRPQDDAGEPRQPRDHRLIAHHPLPRPLRDRLPCTR